MRSRLAPAIVLLTAVLGLAGCSSAEEEPPEVQPTPVVSSSVAPSPEASEETTAPASEAAPATSTATVTTSQAPAPSTSTPQATPRGGAIPGDATPVETFAGSGDTSTGIIQTPSGNIFCDISLDNLICMIPSWMTDLPYGEPNNAGGFSHPLNSVILENGVVKLEGSGGGNAAVSADLDPSGGQSPQVVGYGESVYLGHYACNSREEGLTCWDSRNGSGATINRAGADIF